MYNVYIYYLCILRVLSETGSFKASAAIRNVVHPKLADLDVYYVILFRDIVICAKMAEILFRRDCTQFPFTEIHFAATFMTSAILFLAKSNKYIYPQQYYL